MKNLYNYIIENEDELRALIEGLAVDRLSEQARRIKSNTVFTVIYMDKEDGSLYTYEWTNNSSRPADQNLVGLIAIDDYIVNWCEENTFANYLDVWANVKTQADEDEEELEAKYPAEFEEYVAEGINYAMACLDLDGLISEIKEDVWGYENRW